MSNEWPEAKPEKGKQDSQEAAAKRQWNERYKSENPNPEAKPLTPVVAFFEQYAQEIAGEKVLDLGCGNGRNLCHIAELGFKTAGIDISEEALTQLGEKLQQRNLSAETTQGSFYELPYENNSFGCVVSMNALQQNDEAGVEQSFSEVSRVLKNNGLMLLSVRSNSRELPADRVDIPGKGITFISKEETLSEIMFHHYSREEIEELALKNSLEILEIKEEFTEKANGERNEKQINWTVVFRKKDGVKDENIENVG